MTRMPFVSDSATFSAASRQIEQRMNRVSPSFHSFAWRSKVRGVDATVKLATAAPEGVKRSSGSPVRFPITVMTVSPAMASSFVVSSTSSRSCSYASRVGSSHHAAPTRATACGVRWRTGRTGEAGGSASVRAQDLRPQDGLVQAELAVELLGGVGGRREVDDRVDALGLLLDVVRQAATTPDVHLVDGAAVGLDDRQVLVERRGD